MSDDYLKLSGNQRREMLDKVLLIFGNRCHICGTIIKQGEESLDHIVPRSQGGTSHLANLRPAHRRCNSARGARPLAGVVTDGLSFFWHG